jgi:hypothetical protein
MAGYDAILALGSESTSTTTAVLGYPQYEDVECWTDKTWASTCGDEYPGFMPTYRVKPTKIRVQKLSYGEITDAYVKATQPYVKQKWLTPDDPYYKCDVTSTWPGTYNTKCYTNTSCMYTFRWAEPTPGPTEPSAGYDPD